jgi:outer membrane protein TolC
MSGVRGAEYGMRNAIRSLYSAQSQLINRTISALYDVIKSQKSVVLSEESYKRVLKFYQAAKLKSKIGMSDSLDVYRAETEMRQAEDGYKAAQEKMQEAGDNLRDLLSLPLDVPLIINIPIKHTAITMTYEEAVDTALKNRIDLEGAEDQYRENIRLSKMAKERLWPELNFVLNYSNTGQNELFYESCFRRESTWGVGFTTSTDFNPANERAAYEQSLLSVEAANRGIEQTMATVSLEVKRSMRHLERTFQRIDLEAKQIHTAEGELKLAQIKFDRGMASNFDLIQAEKALRNAKLTHWNALIDHIVGEYQFQGTLGILLEKPKC